MPGRDDCFGAARWCLIERVQLAATARHGAIAPACERLNAEV
jgi:hypothetical protein